MIPLSDDNPTLRTPVVTVGIIALNALVWVFVQQMGTDPALTRSALSDILARLKARKIAVLLCGMVAPPNYGADYSARFNAIYPDIARQFGVPLYPFFLEGVAADARLNQADGLHPTAQGVEVMVRNILPTVEAFVGAISGQRS